MKTRQKYSAITSLLSAIFILLASITFAQSNCDTLRNYTVPTNGYSYYLPTPDGRILGQGIVYDGPTPYKTDIYVEPYNIGSQTTKVRAVLMLPAKVQDNSGSGKITVQVYDDNAGQPGTVIGSQVADFASNFPNGDFYWGKVEFTTPVSVTGKFYVGYKVTYGSPTDTFAMATTNPTANNYTLIHFDGATGSTYDDTWQNFNNVLTSGDNSALAMDILTSTATPPTADFSITNSTEICKSGAFDVDASASTGDITNYEWWLTDNTASNILVQGVHGKVTSVSPSTSNPSNQLLVLFADGACKSDFKFVPVTVDPDVSATINVTDASCGLDNGKIDITNVSGGDGTYTYSIDGGTNTSTTGTYTNLSAGSYDVIVTTNGDGCKYEDNTISISSTPAAIVGVSPTAQTICEGDTLKLTATDNNGGSNPTFKWYKGNVSTANAVGSGSSFKVHPSADATYHVVLTDDNSCNDTAKVDVTVTPKVDPSFSYPSNTLCPGAGTIAATVTNLGTFTVLPTTGLTVNSTTGEITLSGATPGSYAIVNTTTNGSCTFKHTENITITTTPDASFTYPNTDYCQNNQVGTVSPQFTSGSSGAFTSGSGLSISNTGVIDLANSTPGTYTVQNSINVTGCPIANHSEQITINATPTVQANASKTTLCSGESLTLTGSGNADTYSWDNGVTDGTPFTVSTAGTTNYTVTGTVTATGCSATDQVSITVNATPTIDAGQDQSVCKGESVTLTANASAGTVTWDNGVNDGVSFTPNTTMTYTATADNNGCSATDQVTITVNDLPTVNAGTDQTVCINDNPIKLTGTPNGGSFSGIGVNGSIFDPSVAGVGTFTVTYTYTDNNQCSNTDNITVTVDNCAGIKTNSKNSITISPNPASQFIKVDVGTQNIGSIQMVSLTGQIVKISTTKINSHSIKVNVTKLSRGTYFLRLLTKEGITLTKKVIVK